MTHHFTKYKFPAPRLANKQVFFILEWDKELRDLRITTNILSVPEVIQRYIDEKIKLPLEIKTLYRLWVLYHENYNHSGTPRQEMYLFSKFGYKLPSLRKCRAELEKAGLLTDYKTHHNGKPVTYGEYTLSYEIPQVDINVIEGLISECH